MAKKRDKLKAIKQATELRYHSRSGMYDVFDLMRPLSQDGESHCSTCQCRGYLTYTGFSILIPGSEKGHAEIETVREYAIANLDKVIAAP